MTDQTSDKVAQHGERRAGGASPSSRPLIGRAELLRLVVALVVAGAFVATGWAKFPIAQRELRHEPVIVYSEPMLAPLVVRAARVVRENVKKIRGPFDRAEPGKAIPVSLTQYCLQGLTRRDNYVRPGIVAADPRVFPLARYVEVFIGKRYLGRFLVDDTGSKVKGATLDIWTSSCSDARRFGRQRGTATLVVR